jgi:hypothetical protein
VTWILDADRRTLLEEIYPVHDVLVSPTSSDCGAPYAVLEALQAGMAIVLPPLPWLDERLRPPAVTFASRSSTEIARALGELLQPDRLSSAQDSAVKLWQQVFSMEAFWPELLEAYRRALGSGGTC